jgi:hypothetical protein
MESLLARAVVLNNNDALPSSGPIWSGMFPAVSDDAAADVGVDRSIESKDLR